MIPALLILVATAVMAGTGTVVVHRRIRKSAKAPALSARRQRVLQLLNEVIPSQYGDAKFKRIAPGYTPDDPALPKGFTTCGYLPCFIGRELGLKGVTECGLERLRERGRELNAWIEPDGTNRPKPGDLYGIDTTIGIGPNAKNLIVHVGVIVDSSGPVWTTADAGQGSVGTGQAALFVKRPYDPIRMTLGGPAKPRKLAGWIDIDKLSTTEMS